VDRVLDECREVGISIRTVPGRWINEGDLQHRGTYSDEKMVLSVARDSPQWFETLIHEYCHMQQHLEGMDWFQPGATSAWNRYYAWCTQSAKWRESLILDTRFIQLCELDAERRALAIMRRYRFPTIDIDEYARGANSYVYEHEAQRLVRNVSLRRPEKVQAIRPLLSTRLIKDHQVGLLPNGFLDLYIRHCV